MSSPWESEQGGDVPISRHRSVASFITNASAAAESTYSLGMGEGAWPLSEFPQPPTELPSEPSTPIGTIYNKTSASRLRPPEMGTLPLELRRYEPAPTRSESPSPPRYSIRRQHPQNAPSSSSRSPQAEASTSQRGARPQPSPTSPGMQSPYDWHEGSSRIIVDPNEERMLSTTLITHLLAETESGSSCGDSAIDIPYASRPWRSRTGQGSAVRGDRLSSTSASSEMTYPPPSMQTSRSGNPGDPSAARPSRSRPPPSAYPAAEDDHRLTLSSDITPRVSDAGSSHPEYRMLPTTGPQSGPRGANGRWGSISGTIPSSFRTMSVSSSANDHHSMSSSTVPLNRPFLRDSHLDGRKADVPEDVGPPSTSHEQGMSPSGGTQNRPRDKHHRARHSFQSTKTTKSYVSSFISKVSNSSGAKSVKHSFSWRRGKALPPVPVLPNNTITQEREYRKIEDSIPLPDLVNRAGALSTMLEKGHNPHDSGTSLPLVDDQGTHDALESPPLHTASSMDLDNTARTTGFWHPSRDTGHQRNRTGDQAQWRATMMDRPKVRSLPMSKKNKIRLGISVAVAIVLGVVGALVGIDVMRGRSHSTSGCSGDLTGSACNLDATCVCTSSLSDQCDQLAQALMSLLPSLNTLFTANFTANSLSTAVWQAQGAPVGGNCASQANLIDVAPALDPQSAPNRTQWAQAALLWNLVQSQDLTAVSKMQQFIKGANWNSLSNLDGPVPDPSSKFSISASGFVFDFASQTMTCPSVSFVNDGQPSSAQISEVSNTALAALNRMYSYALASSTQRQDALANYWRSTLLRPPADLARFVSAMAASNVLIPFDAASSSVANLLTNSSSAPFPPPLACYPGLTEEQWQTINIVETEVFGLYPAYSGSQFDTDCFPNRPLYGVVDVLRLRLPFMDARTGVAKQAAVLSRDTLPRAVVYSGEVLSALPGASNIPDMTTATTDPREYGTFNHLNHVLLNYLSSIPDVSVANALVDFVLTSSAVPPVNTSTLFQSIATIPVLEVAIFGSITPSDVSGAVSSFSTPHGNLFFGSDQGAALRDWAITATQSSVLWTDSATAPEVVHDGSLTDSTFLSVWNPASTFLYTPNSGVVVDVSNITTAFADLQEFSPS